MFHGVMMFRTALAATLLISTACASPIAAARPSSDLKLALRTDQFADVGKKPQEIRSALDDALMQDPTSVRLNFLSGLVYDAQSSAGSEGRQLARVGYFTALRSDPTFWPANYQLGLLAMEDGDALAAERYLAAAAYHAVDSAPVFYALARAAYCAGDQDGAALALARATSLAPPARDDERITAALVSAVKGDGAAVDSWLGQLSQPAQDYARRELRGRTAELLQAGPADPAAVPPAMAPAPAPAPGAAPKAAGRRMATVDVVIIRRKEERSRTTGINLLDALTLQFGSTLINSERTRASDRLTGTISSDGVSTIQNLSLTVPSVTYSLNIANASGNKSAIEARPTLLIYDGQTSKVFSGGTLTYAASGQLSSESYTREVGLSLSVTPKFNDNGTINLSIATALETFITEPTAGTFREAVQTDKSSTEITADMHLGETIVVSGGKFSNLQSGSSSTPVLGSIPVIKHLFAEKANYYVTNDLLVLLSLRGDASGSAMGSDGRVPVEAERLWRKLGMARSTNAMLRASEDHRSLFELENPGRQFKLNSMELFGLGDMFAR